MTPGTTPTTPAITGLGCISPLGSGVGAQVRAIRADRVALAPFEAMEQARAVAAEALCGGECGSLNDQPIHERAAQGLKLAVREALEDARGNADAPPYPPERIAAVFGTSLHGMNAAGAWLRGAPASVFQTFQAGHVLDHALAGLPVGGARVTCSSACASSLSAVAHARTLLETGAADLVICGGYDPVSEYAVAGFHSLQVVSPDTLRPFARDRRGMQVSEGYGVLVLERAGDAARRGARVHALVAGMGESSDAHHLTQPRPDGGGAAAVLNDALREAGLAPDSIELIVAHATGTRDNDAAEAKAYDRVFGQPTPRVTALKSRVGHTLGAAGSIEAILARACLDDGLIPSTANVTGPQVGEPVSLVTGSARPIDEPVAHTVSCSLGFGGANAAFIQTRPDRGGDLRCEPQPPPYRVGITGVGVVLPGAVGPGLPDRQALWQTGTIDPATIKPLLPRAKARRLSPLSRFAITATRFALQDAGFDNTELPGLDAPAHERPACLVASTNGSTSFAYNYYRALVEADYKAANPLMFAEGVPNAPAAHISMVHRLHGTSQSIIGTHTSGLDALCLAARRIASGRWTTAVVCLAEEDHALVREVTHGCGHIDADAPACEGAVAWVLQRLAPDQPALAELYDPVQRSTGNTTRLIASLYNGDGPTPMVCPTDRRLYTALKQLGCATLPHAPWFSLGSGLTLLNAIASGGPGPARLVAGCPTGLVTSLCLSGLGRGLSR